MRFVREQLIVFALRLLYVSSDDGDRCTNIMRRDAHKLVEPLAQLSRRFRIDVRRLGCASARLFLGIETRLLDE